MKYDEFNTLDLQFFKQICHAIDETPSITKIKKGASSNNYLIKTKDCRFFIKQLYAHQEKTEQTIIHNLKLAQQADILSPRFILSSLSHLLCLEFMDGKPLRKINTFYLNQLWNEYQKFQNISYKSVKQPLQNLQNLSLSCQNKLNRLTKKSFFKRVFLNYLIKTLVNLPQKELIYHHKKLQVIHGDFHHNNIFFYHKKLSGILDWEELRRGYATEDWVRFTFCFMERSFLLHTQQGKSIFKFLLSQNRFSRQEWALGFNLFLLKKIYKTLHKKHLSLFQLIKTTHFLILWKREKTWVLKRAILE